MRFLRYTTKGGIRIRRTEVPEADTAGIDALIDRLETRRGLLLASGVDCPGRYRRHAIGFADPPLVVTGGGRDFTIEALNGRGRMLLPPIEAALAHEPAILSLERRENLLGGTVRAAEAGFTEEQRSRQPSLFSVLRALAALFASAEDRHLGLYGAFGYDLVFQFEPIARRLPRAAEQRDLVLYLPDEILVVDHAKATTCRYRYVFETIAGATDALPGETAPAPYRRGCGAAPGDQRAGDHAPGEYEALVERARAAFARDDLFEVVLSQLFTAPCADGPATIFRRLADANPAPYGALVNLGRGEFLVAASPEMYVRVEGGRVETCPISGTIARGADPLEDAERIRTLLNSAKDAAELTMCTDVDRNDKSRICEAASIRVLGRRQIELYQRLIHTVDHVEGRLRPEFDALDAFLSHAWAVTVTGAPKPGAIRFIEQEERSARGWYGGAFGRLGFDGTLDTGLTLRTVRLMDGRAEIRAGATLLHDSDPAAEDAECRLKAAALLDAIAGARPAAAPARRAAARAASVRHVLLIDHEDSFVHTLAGYFRAAGAAVETRRPDLARAALRAGAPPDLVVLSAGPGRPADFAMDETLDLLIRRRLPVFGVCLGLQGIVLHFGGALRVLDRPMHGKPSTIRRTGGKLLAGLPERFAAGRYHSLHACPETLPEVLTATAVDEHGVVMAVEHATLPIAAVQFHPESIMTAAGRIGLPLVEAALWSLAG
jgi:anthranilate synthase